MTIRIQEIAEHQVKYFEEQALDQIETLAKRLEEKAQELRKKKEDIAEGDDIGELRISQEERISWAVNDVENLLRNLNISQLVTTTYKLGKAKIELKNIEKNGEEQES